MYLNTNNENTLAQNMTQPCKTDTWQNNRRITGIPNYISKCVLWYPPEAQKCQLYHHVFAYQSMCVLDITCINSLKNSVLLYKCYHGIVYCMSARTSPLLIISLSTGHSHIVPGDPLQGWEAIGWGI